MTKLVIAVGVVIVMFLTLQFTPNDFSASSEVIEVEVIKETQPTWAVDEDAVRAAQEVIHRKELQAELNALESDFEALSTTYEAGKEAYIEEKKRIEIELENY